MAEPFSVETQELLMLPTGDCQQSGACCLPPREDGGRGTDITHGRTSSTEMPGRP